MPLVEQKMITLPRTRYILMRKKFPKSNDSIIERDKIYISNIKIHYSSIVWLGHVYTINAIYHQITKGKD
jgi:hypothetical protein